ncbi:alpha/beta fold hydrolase [Cytobacillus horneckiae]|uniref:esterase/lipase family protein n=1 Tax=Cytobacillus horneckiae TaxID=549687 RepID=UPI0034CE8188
MIYLKKIVSLVSFVSLLFFAVSPVTASAQNELTGKLKPPGESFTPGDWFLGSTPPNLDPNKPPIVFVQGKNGSSTSWYGETEYHGVNDMYTKAYEAGYQTVFVQLYDAAGNGSSSQYANGELLASLLQDISQHFNGKKVNIIAHSKGGPDTQAALIHYGAHQYVGRVFTLGSPHHGSHLADLAYSWWAGWLGTLLGQKDDGTYSLQVGEMAHFRSLTDNHSNALKNKYYTVAGTNKGPAMSALWMGGQYLSSHGSNDGLVNEWSTLLPYGNHLFTDSAIDHDRIRMGSAVFSRIEPQLRTASIAGVSMKSKAAIDKEQVISTEESYYVHGGQLLQNQTVSNRFFVNDETLEHVNVLTASANDHIKMISPSGKVYQSIADISGEETSFFNGAAIHSFKNINTEQGEWQIDMNTNEQQNAYLLTVQYSEHSPIKMDMVGMAKGNSAAFSITASQTLKNLSFDIHLTDESGKVYSTPSSIQEVNQAHFIGQLPAVSNSGVYNVTIDIKGQTNKGAPFNRTIIRSVYIEKP